MYSCSILLSNTYTEIKIKDNRTKVGLSPYLTSGLQACFLQMCGYNLETIWKCFLKTPVVNFYIQNCLVGSWPLWITQLF